MNEAARDFIERIGVLAEEHGFARIAGRLIGLLLLEPGPLSLDELAELLQVSKASVSTNARLLEQLGIVERVGHPGERRDYYRISDDPWEQLFAVVRRRMERMREALCAGCEALPAEMGVGRRRLRDWERFHAFVLNEFESKIERWRSYRSGEAPGSGAGSPAGGVAPPAEETT